MGRFSHRRTRSSNRQLSRTRFGLGQLAGSPQIIQLMMVIRLLSVPLASLLLAGCGSQSLCSSKTLQVARDLGSDRYAATEVRNCGATTDYATVVRVGRVGEAAADATEVFVADSDHGTAVGGEAGSIWMNVVWSASGKLLIAFASGARVFKHLPDAKDAHVEYRASGPYVPPPPPPLM